MPSPRILVCFAVKEEARPFVSNLRGSTTFNTLITGMGWKNAGEAIDRALVEFRPDLVLSCGFAGGLDPAHRPGAILFETDQPQLAERCSALGAKSATFVCSPKVLSKAEEKLALRERSKADAVEMESGIIRRCCQERGVASATIRVIIDPVEQDLPLDLENVLTTRKRISAPKLACALLASPSRIKSLIDLRSDSIRVAKELGAFLERLLAPYDREHYGKGPV